MTKNMLDVLLATYQTIADRRRATARWTHHDPVFAKYRTPAEVVSAARSEPEILIALAVLANINDDAFVGLAMVMRPGLLAFVKRYAGHDAIDDVVSESIVSFTRRIRGFAQPRLDWGEQQTCFPAAWILSGIRHAPRTMVLNENRIAATSIAFHLHNESTELANPPRLSCGADEALEVLREALNADVVDASEAGVIARHFLGGESISAAASAMGWRSNRVGARDTRIERARLAGCIRRLNRYATCEPNDALPRSSSSGVSALGTLQIVNGGNSTAAANVLDVVDSILSVAVAA
jgi:DNA-directed RNA polymerase specialized sigma24 family protein